MSCAPQEGPLREKRLTKAFAKSSKSPIDVEMATRSIPSGAAMRCHGRSVQATQPHASRRATPTNLAILHTLTLRILLSRSVLVKVGIMWRSRSSPCPVICGMAQPGTASVTRSTLCHCKTPQQQPPQPLHRLQARHRHLPETVQVDL